MTETLALSLAYVLDLIIGDPRWIPHPVGGIGRLIEKIERTLRKVAGLQQDNKTDVQAEENEQDERAKVKYRINLNDLVPSFLRKGKELSWAMQENIAGVILVVLVAGASFGFFYLVSHVLFSIHFTPVAEYTAFAVYVYFVSATLATRGLISAAKSVIKELGKGDVGNSRHKLSMIVGRDTQSLKEAGLLKATIESLSENASDGIIAPLFYFVLGGLPLAMAYKAVNTLDSMVGYKNERYKNFGWAAARLDDIANYIPARITGVLIVAAVYFINMFRYIVNAGRRRLASVRNRAGRYLLKVFAWIERRTEESDFEMAHNAVRIMKRDGKKHSSPNSGIPEAAMAGALGIRLGGPSTYEGVEFKKPYIGDNAKRKELRERGVEVYFDAARTAITITRLTSLFGFLAAVLFV
jgi:adenosylcobinamide-phosphate synthase